MSSYKNPSQYRFSLYYAKGGGEWVSIDNTNRWVIDMKDKIPLNIKTVSKNI